MSDASSLDVTGRASPVRMNAVMHPTSITARACLRNAQRPASRLAIREAAAHQQRRLRDQTLGSSCASVWAAANRSPFSTTRSSMCWGMGAGTALAFTSSLVRTIVNRPLSFWPSRRNFSSPAGIAVVASMAADRGVQAGPFRDGACTTTMHLLDDDERVELHERVGPAADDPQFDRVRARRHRALEDDLASHTRQRPRRDALDQ